MERIVKTKIPVNYISTKDGNNALLYQTVDTLESKVYEYEEDCKKIEMIFAQANDNFSLIGNRIRKIIESSFTNKQDLRFIMSNEWILRFAYTNDLKKLLSNPDFIISTVKIKVPYDAYIGDKHQIVFTKEEQIPVWEMRKKDSQSSVIDWLITDKYNTFQERLDALILGDHKNALEIIKNNNWLLMLVNEQERIRIMHQFQIEMISINKFVGYDKQRHLVRRKIIIPASLSHKYQKMEQEIEKLFAAPGLDEVLLRYAYDHSTNTCMNDENQLLRENLWLLNLVDLDTQLKLLEILKIKVNSESRKTIITLGFNPVKNDFYLYHKNVDIGDYDEYHKLNEKLFAIISKESFSLSELEQFIKSSHLVLKIWPWLIEHNTLTNMAVANKTK